LDCDAIKRKVGMILQSLDCLEKEVSILFVDDAGIQKLNRQYRDIDQPTDVLSFPQTGDEPDPLDSPLLGDVVISTEMAWRQAGEHGLGLEEELLLLLIHGILHLLGYDHERSENDAHKMKTKTRQLFSMVFPGKEPAKSCDF